MFAALTPMQPVPSDLSHYPWTPARPSPLSQRKPSTAVPFTPTTTTTPAPQPQFQPPLFTFTSSLLPFGEKSGTTAPLRTIYADADTITSPTPSSTYATRYKNTISNPLFAHSAKRTHISSTSPRARSVRCNAFLNRVKQNRDNGRVEARAEQLAYMDDIAEQKEWAENMNKREEEIQARYGLGIEEGEREDGYEHLDAVDEAEIQALDEYLEQERAMEMALLEAVDADGAVGDAGHQSDGTGNRANNAASSFSDEEYENIFMDLVDHSPSEDMDMSG